MKLNLLPTHVSKEKATRSAWIIAILVFLVLFGGSIFLIKKGNQDFADSLNGVAQDEGNAAKAKQTADAADQVIAQSTTLLRNTLLAQKMISHNGTYPDIYDQVRRYIPGFYRVSSMAAQASGPGVSTITLVGVLDSDQQYADLMLALLRWDKVSSLSRAGFANTNMYVPAPTPDDQVGKPIKPGEAPIPDDPAKRLDYFLAKGRVDGYLATGGFGAGQAGAYGTMPGSSQVTVTMVVGIDLQTPDPRATFASGGAGSAGPTASGPAATGGSLPVTPPAKSAPTSTSGRSGKKGASEDDTGD